MLEATDHRMTLTETEMVKNLEIPTMKLACVTITGLSIFSLNLAASTPERIDDWFFQVLVHGSGWLSAVNFLMPRAVIESLNGRALVPLSEAPITRAIRKMGWEGFNGIKPKAPTAG